MTAVRKELRRRRKPLWFATAFVALAAVLVFAFAASANLPNSTFEGNDGNFVVNTPGNTDWVNVHGGVTTGVDLPTGQTDNSFGNGTKESDVNVTVGTGSIPNSKADLGNFYVASETLPAPSNHVLMYLGWTRVNTSGTTNFDFEINQAAQPDLTTPGPKTLVRTPGDIIINYDFQGGAQTPTLAFRTWQANGTWSGATPITGTNGEAEVNRVDLANPLAQPPSPATAPAFTFGEAAIDLTALGIVSAGECNPFSSAYVKSRASDAFTSAVKDFIAPVALSLNTCGNVIIRKQTDPASDPAQVQFGYTADIDSDPSQSNTFSLGHGQSKNYNGTVLQGNGYTVDETSQPAGWEFVSVDCSASSGVTPTIVGSLVTFDIDSPSDVLDCTYHNRARATLIVEKITDDGFGAFDFTSGTLSPSPFTLTTTAAGAGGKDSRTFSNLVPGNYDVAETVPAGWNLVSSSCTDGSPINAIALGAGESVTCTFHDARERGSIDILKLRKHAAGGSGDQPHPGVTFTITGGGLPAGGVTAVTGNDGHACVQNLVVSSLVGQYTVTESVPSGYHAQDGPQNVSVVEGGACGAEPNPDADVQFDNIPLTDVTITINSQVPGGTDTQVDCNNNALDLDTDATGDGTASANNQEPQVIQCTITVDP
jgi:hypothetical protein